MIEWSDAIMNAIGGLWSWLLVTAVLVLALGSATAWPRKPENNSRREDDH